MIDEQSMNVDELYEYITKNSSAEQVLRKMLDGHVSQYNKLRFDGNDEIHPIILITMATRELNWNIAISNGDDDDDVLGMIIGTNEYINSVLQPKLNENLLN